jgi:DNA-binding protein H-NS
VATLKELQEKIAKLQSQADEIIAKQSSGVVEKIRDLMAKHGLTIADIEAHRGNRGRGGKPGGKVAPKAAKYRDPKSGATWTGHGRAPRWIADVKDRPKFLIPSTGTAVDSEVASKPRGAGKVTIKKRKEGQAPGEIPQPEDRRNLERPR